MNLARPLRIVLVEDNSADVFLVEESLRQHGVEFELLRFECGEEALGYLCRSLGTAAQPAFEDPDLILLDLHLPGACGSEVLVAIRLEPRLAHVPVVIMSGAPPESLRSSDLVGSNRFIRKSTNVEHYLQEIGRAVLDLVPAEVVGRRA